MQYIFSDLCHKSMFDKSSNLGKEVKEVKEELGNQKKILVEVLEYVKVYFTIYTVRTWPKHCH